MAVRVLQYSFTSGEVSPQLLSRLDNDLYKNGLQKARNVYLNPEGYVSRREGLAYIDGTTSDAEAVLIDFEYNTVQTYLLVFTAGQFKVYKNDVLQATVTSGSVGSLTLAQIKAMKWTQSADTLFLFLGDVQTIKITRTSDTVWTVASVAYTNIPVYPFSGVTVTSPAATLTPSATTGKSITLTASAAVFNAGHVGQYVSGHQGGVVFITSYTDSTHVVGDVQSDFANTTAIASGNWDLETGYEPVWSNTRGWPSCGVFYQGRFYVASSTARPQTIWGSKSGDFFNFNVGKGLDDDAIDVTIDDDQVNAILSLFPGRNLQVFTTGGEYYVPIEPTKPITPSQIQVVRSTTHGSLAIQPVSVDGTTVFIERSGYVVRDFTFNELEQTYNADNISILSSHLIRNPVDMRLRRSTQTTPTDFLYMVNSDGTCAVFNSLRSQELRAWTLFETDGNFERVSVVDRSVYFVVKRNINGVDKRFIEKLDVTLKTDCAKLQTAGSPTTSWSGLSHLNGETVKVIGDNYILNDETVSSGSITVEEAVSSLEGGLMFAALIQTMPADIALGNGQTITANWKRIIYATIRLLNSRNIIVQAGRGTYRPAFRFVGSTLLDVPVPLFTGLKKVFTGGVNRDASITITQDDPLEFNILGLVIGVST